DGKYSGRSLADAIVSELTRINQTYEPISFEGRKVDSPLPSPKVEDKRALPDLQVSGGATMPQLQVSVEATKLPDLSLDLAGTKFSFASVLQLWTRREPELLITGSLQILGSNVRAVARINRLGLQSGSAVRDVVAKVESEDQISDLLPDLAFQIYFE